MSSLARGETGQGLPIPLTTLIGRAGETTEVRALLGREDVRLVTLTGPGGVGKSRLALRVAAEWAAGDADGVRLVGLASVGEPDLVAPAIAQALGVVESGEAPLVDQIAEAVGGRNLLLVLDSFEQVADAAPLLVNFLAVCPNLKLLVTSRVLLHITGEQVYPVPPLPLPNTELPASFEQVAAADAVRLFVARAKAAAPTFALTAENAGAVVEICRKVDGLPLAIELAAARVRLFTPDALLARLEHRLPFLTGGPHDVPARQRTLRDTIAWSYDLLDPAGQAFFRRLAVFAGGFTLDAAERVGSRESGVGREDVASSPDSRLPPPVSVLDRLAALADHSLLLPTQIPGAETRFTLLDTVREFGLERLAASGEQEDARRWHADWCLAMVAAAEAAIGTAAQQEWVFKLNAEHDNLRAALNAAQATGDNDTLIRLAGGLWRFWYGRGYLTEGRLWLAQALSATEQSPSTGRLTLLVGSGALAHAQGDQAAAVAFLEQALALARRNGDRRGLAMALNQLGVVARDRGDYASAVTHLQESLTTFRALHDQWGTTLSINALAILYQRRGEYDRAAETLAEGVALARAQGDQWSTAQALSNTAHLAHRQGDFARAVALYEESAALYQQLGDRRGEAGALTNLGRIAERQGDTDRAIALHEESLGATRALGDRRGIATTLANLCLAYLRRDDLEQALRAAHESLSIRYALSDREGIATSLEQVAEIAAAHQQMERAAFVRAAAAAARDAIGAPLAPAERASYDTVVTAVRAALAPERFSAIWAAGREVPLNDAVDFALHDRPLTITLEASGAGRAAKPERSSGARLSDRELDVLRLLEQFTDREIADRLYIGTRTVSTHVTNIMNKLGVNSRTAAVAYAIRHGLI